MIEKYRGDNVHFRAHGILGGRPEPPDFDSRGNPEHRILAFGKVGHLQESGVAAGGLGTTLGADAQCAFSDRGRQSSATPGYIESVAESMKDNPRVEFTGYVEEDDIPRLFRSASVLVLPYSSATGASGVAHLACEFGVPIISAGIDDFREMALDEGLAVAFYETGRRRQPGG